MAQSFAQPAHLVSMATIAPTAVREFGPEKLEPPVKRPVDGYFQRTGINSLAKTPA